MVERLQPTVSPADGDVAIVRVTVPVKPFWLVTVAVNVPVSVVDVKVSAAKLIVNGEVEPLV
jgi:hypothetical protein